MNRKRLEFSIGLTMGDPGGIGPEVLIKAIQELKNRLPARFVIIGSGNILEWYCLKLKIRNFFQHNEVSLLDLNNVKERSFKFGINSPHYGKASLEYLNKAIELLKGKKISCLVTCPVSKGAINLYRRNFIGHTEYLAGAFGIKKFAMMMLNRNLRVIPLTRHIALKDVSGKINYSLVYEGIELAVDYLKKYFAITHPCIAVCSLNPHSGESGFIGKEEREIIIPAIRDFKQKILAKVEGPFSADGLFSQWEKPRFDCIIGMYHDQVLIPVKMTDSHRTVNLTLGLPFIRTSPSHGTGFDIAGKGVASSTSMMEAIKLAYHLSHNVISY